MAARKKLHWLWLITLLIIALVLSGCARAGAPTTSREEAYDTDQAASDGFGYGGGEAEAPPAEPALPTMGAQFYGTEEPAAEPGAGNQQVERLIIRNGSITVSVEDTRAARDAIEQMIDEMAAQGGFVVNVSESGGTADSSPYITMQIRVPAQRFDEAMDRIADMAVEGTQPTRSENAQDVTEEYVDLQARLESLEAARDRLLQIMENSQTTEELLQAEAQLTAREAEIEAIKGRMQYLSQSAALSSISVSLQPYILSQPVDTSWRPAETVRRAVEALIDSLRGAAEFVIYFGIACFPWLLVLGVIGFFGFRFVRSLIRRRRARQQGG